MKIYEIGIHPCCVEEGANLRLHASFGILTVAVSLIGFATVVSE